MKKNSIVILTVAVWSVTAVSAGAQSTEIGIIAGEPTGLSVKFWTSGKTAADFGVAWSFGGSGSMHLHSDYLFHFWLNSGSAFYTGLGGRILVKDSSELAARIPFGLQINTARGRLAIFLELVPMLDILPDTHSDFDVNGALGLRFRF